MDSSSSYSRSRKITDEVRKRPLPDLGSESDAINLRIVYPTTLYVVGVDKDLDSKEVGGSLSRRSSDTRTWGNTATLPKWRSRKATITSPPASTWSHTRKKSRPLLPSKASPSSRARPVTP